MRTDPSWPVASPDGCLEVFLQALHAWTMPLRDGQTIIEVGCAEANWLALAQAALPNATLIGIDVRPCERPGIVMCGDVRRVDWPRASADWVVFISSLEHIGLGYYGDPVYPHGDAVALAKVHTWLKPGGSLYFDVPYRATGTRSTPKERWYDTAMLHSLAQGWTVRREGGWRVATPTAITEHVACWWTTPGGLPTVDAHA